MRVWAPIIGMVGLVVATGLYNPVYADRSDMGNADDDDISAREIQATRAQLDADPPNTNDIQPFGVSSREMDAVRQTLDEKPLRTDVNSKDLELAPGQMDDVRQALDRNPPRTDVNAPDLELAPSAMQNARDALDRNPPRTDVNEPDLELPSSAMQDTREDLERYGSSPDSNSSPLNIDEASMDSVRRDLHNASGILQHDSQNVDDLTAEYDANGLVIRNPRWEFGVSYGRWLAQDKSVMSFVVPSLLNEIFIDNNGNYYVPIVGATTVKTKFASSSDYVQVDGYGPLSKHFSLGLEWGINLSHDDVITDQGYYNQAGYDLVYRTQTMHVAPELKWTESVGPVSLYLVGGAGWYRISENLQASFDDLGLAQLNFSDIPLIDQTADYFGANGGAGIGLRILSDATIGIDVRYHQVFGTPSIDDAIVPTGNIHFVF